MATQNTTQTDVKRVPASELKVGDVIGTTRSDTRAAVEAGASERDATGRSRGNGVAVIAKITDGPGGRVQARDEDGRMIRSTAPETKVWRARTGETKPAAKPVATKVPMSLHEAILATPVNEADYAPEAVKPKPAKAKAAATATKSKAAPAKPEFEWPKPPAKLLGEYLKARVTADADGPNRKQPFINEGGVLRLHSTDWIEWLVSQGIAVSKSVAAEPLRAAGLAVKSFPLPGEDRAFGFYTGPAPAGTDKLPRRAGAARAPRAPRNPFDRVSEQERSFLVEAVLAQPESDLRAGLLEQLIAAAKD
jgi:hypothetical protein